MGSDILKPLAPYFQQICWVVSDMDKAIDWLKTAFGVPYFARFTIDLPPEQFSACGVPTRMVHDTALGWTGSFFLEVVVPETESMHAAFLRRHGPGIQHIGYLVPEFAPYYRHFKDLGMRELQYARRDDGDFAFEAAHMDFGPHAPTVVELLWLDQKGIDFHEGIKRAA